MNDWLPMTFHDAHFSLGRADLHNALVAGELTKIRRNAYAAAVPDSPDQRHLQLIRSTVPQLRDDYVLSSSSAAILHGLWVPVSDLRQVHITRDKEGGGGSSPQLRSYACPLADDEIVEIDGMRVTSLARTALDCLRHLEWRYAFPAGDSALARGLERGEVEELLRRYPRRPGNAKARLALPLLNALSESAGESTSRAIFHDYGLPTPELQHEVRYGGVLVARVDFWWEEYGLAGEYDGEQKYVDPSMNASPDSALAARFERDSDVRRAGAAIVHWTSADLRQPGALVDRIRAEMRETRNARGARKYRYDSVQAAMWGQRRDGSLR